MTPEAQQDWVFAVIYNSNVSFDALLTVCIVTDLSLNSVSCNKASEAAHNQLLEHLEAKEESHSHWKINSCTGPVLAMGKHTCFVKKPSGHPRK